MTKNIKKRLSKIGISQILFLYYNKSMASKGASKGTGTRTLQHTNALKRKAQSIYYI